MLTTRKARTAFHAFLPTIVSNYGSNLGCTNRKNKNTTQGRICVFILARPAGFEPATCGLEIRCSIQLG